MKDERQAYLLLMAIILLWGANWPIMKYGLQFISPLWFASIRLLLGSLCLFALISARKEFSMPNTRDLPILISVGFLQLGLGLAFIHFGLTVVDAGRSAILAYTTPLWVTPLAVIALKEKISMTKGCGLCIGIIGIAVLFNPNEFNFTNIKGLIGNGYLILSAMLLAIVIIHVRYHEMKMRPLQLMPWQMLIGGKILAICAIYWEGTPDIEFTLPITVILAYNGIIASAFCFWAYQTIMRILPATSTSLGSLGVPVAGILFSSVTLGEPITMNTSAGIILISIGVSVLIVESLFWNKDNLTKK